MPLSEVIPPPEWVEYEADETSGLDLLGLRLPVQSIGNHLLNGVTTITPTVRYLSLRTWLLDCYLRADPPPPDRLKSFVAFAQNAEAAITLGNLLAHPQTVGLIGPRKGALKLEGPEDPLMMERLAKQPAVLVYARPSEQLRLTHNRDPGVPELGTEKGVPLVAAVDQVLGTTVIGGRLRSGRSIESATRAEMEEFGGAAWVGDVPPQELDCLIDCILPADAAPDERNRVATYAALLALAGLHEDSHIGETALFYEAARPERRTHDSLNGVLDGWLPYLVRDSIAVTAEYTLLQLLQTIKRLDPSGFGVLDEQVVIALLDAGADDAGRLLVEFGLADNAAELADMPFVELEGRVRATCREQTGVDGLRRWAGGLSEVALYGAAPGAREAVTLTGMLSWILADWRAGEVVRGGMPAADLLSYQGIARFGLQEIVLPRLRDWRGRDVSALEAMREYAHLVLDQHLRIAWTRLAADPKRDVAVLTRDGDRLFARMNYDAGRTASRIDQVVRWLGQLKLLQNGVPTASGREALARCLQALQAS